MEAVEQSVALGKRQAERLVREERVEYRPFVALSDLHLVRKTFAVDYPVLLSTLEKYDPTLGSDLADAVARLAEEQGAAFSRDAFARGFVEGIAAIWEKIRDKL